MSKGINLLINKKQRTISPLLFDRLRLTRLFAIGLLFLIGSVAIILFLLISISPLPGLRKQEAYTLTNIAAYHLNIGELILTHDRLKNISDVIEKRTYYDKKINVIENNLPEGITIKTLKMADKTIFIEGTSNSLESINTFFDNLLVSTGRNKEFTSVDMLSLSFDKDKQSFTFQLNLATL